MELDEGNFEVSISAKVYHYDEDKEIHYVKALLLEDLYISGITVRPSPKRPEDGLWVQMPSYKKDKQYKRYVEFKSHDYLRQLIEEAAIQAVERYSAADVLPSATDIARMSDEIDF